MNKKELCPVCGYNVLKNLGVYPWNDNISSLEICSSCGIQFGYEDVAGGDLEKREGIYNDWRKKWVENGMNWWGDRKNKPRDWDPEKQLNALLED